jgi:MFS transporter, UMF1 family
MTVTTPRRVTKDRREIRSWYFYDWANSAFSTTVIAVFFAPYLTNIAEAAADAQGNVSLLWMSVSAESYYPFILSGSVILQVLVLPVIGAIADRMANKKVLMGVFAYLGSFSTMALYFVEGEKYALGGTLIVIANLTFGAAIVVYNSFLPDISTPDERDAVSSRGWAMGYVGGGLLLVANLAMYSMHESFGLTEGEAVRINLFSAGAWWALFTLIPLRGLARHRPHVRRTDKSVIITGFSQLRQTFRDARKYPITLLFLGAYLLYNDGVQTVIAMAAVYANRELLLEIETLTVGILLVQIVAAVGAVVAGQAAGSLGAKRVLLFSISLWTVVIAVGFILPAGKPSLFLMLAGAIGFVLGGSQALSRSLFSLLIPRDKEAEYFSFYEISERGTAWLGTFMFGIALNLTDSYRIAILGLVIFFVVGGALLVKVDVRRGIEAVGNEVPQRV